MPRPLIIALVGIDGAGKSTQARQLAEWLDNTGVRSHFAKNPGGRLRLDRIARGLGRPDAISLLGRYGFLTVEVLVRWLMIARSLAHSQLTRRVAVMDRYTLCEYAVIRAREDRGERVARTLNAVFPTPDMVCFLAVEPPRAKARIEKRGTDSETLGYLTALDASYRSLPEAEQFTVVDANGDVATVQAALRTAVTGHLSPSEAVT
ncbi:MAG: dTMP kinase [Micromonosporaceae bacterium]